MIVTTRFTAGVRSPAVFREQLLLNFVENLGWVQALPEGYDLLSRLQNWFTRKGTAIAAATDCLLLTQFAHDAKDERWRQEGIKRHGAAISVLRKALRRSHAATDDDLLSATDALGVCEALGMGSISATVPQGEDAWRQHALGLCTLLNLRGPASLSANNCTFDMVFNAMYVGLVNNVSCRKALLFGEHNWQRALEASCSGRMWCLFHIVCRFPALLERMDALNPKTQPNREVVRLLSDLIELQDRVQRWLLLWYKQSPELLVRTVSVTEYPFFVAIHGPLADQFPIALAFESPIEAIGHLNYWTLLLFIRQAIYDLASQPYAKYLTSECQRAHFRLSVYECADAICQCAPFYLSPSSPSHEWRDGGGERDLYGSMYWAARWYEKEHDRFKADFCKSVIGAHMLNSGERQPSPSPAGADHFHVIGKGFLLLRFVWQDCVGPTRCACASSSSLSGPNG